MSKNFIIGKYTLESLTNGMYANPFDLLREYVQNSVDSIDVFKETFECNYESNKIQIVINTIDHSIGLYDNGTGIKSQIAYKTLLDIGNSQKDLRKSRGFRGIGRLSGLGYCDQLTFTTSYSGESIKSILTFDSRKLKELLIPSRTTDETLEEVISQVITFTQLPEKAKAHYFSVEMTGVPDRNGLLDSRKVKDYLIQNMPLYYNKDFKFGELITSKIAQLGYHIPCYQIELVVDGQVEPLYKPYSDILISDRVKHAEERIQDIIVHRFCRGEETTAILWYAKTNFNGTVLNNQTKGIRIRKGNVLIGNHFTMNRFFKEDRFNGWLIGELFVLDVDVIPNARRDDFEQNTACEALSVQIQEWASQISKDIRKASYQRSLSETNRKIVETEDINNLMIEDLGFDDDESSLLNTEESFEIAQVDLIDKLALILGTKEKQTKYSALNINSKLTGEQRKTLERVFDILKEHYPAEITDGLIETVAKKF